MLTFDNVKETFYNSFHVECDWGIIQYEKSRNNRHKVNRHRRVDCCPLNAKIIELRRSLRDCEFIT